MKLNTIWGYGQIFAYSGIEGVNDYYHDYVGTLTNKKIEIRFETRKWVKLYFPIEDIKFKSVMSDFIEGDNFFITYSSSDTLVGYSNVLPIISGESKLTFKKADSIDIYSINDDYFGLSIVKSNNLYEFVFAHGDSINKVIDEINKAKDIDISLLKNKRYEYYLNMPECKNKKYEELYYKALSVNKVNVFTKIGNIKTTWTTPDRVPHKHMWLWDSVFHALSFVLYNPEMAKCSIKAVLDSQREDGFIAHMIKPDSISNITQPQVLSWGVYNVYKKTNDIEFLKECALKLDKYLKWDIENRDKNKNGLLEWHTSPLNLKCKCDESGLDNSPRFDFDIDMDAIDFTVFSVHDAYYLSLIYKELGNDIKSGEWMNYYKATKDLVNDLMWDDETGAYYDRLFNSKLTKVLTPASFLPMFASIPTKEQAEKMVKLLTRSDELYTDFPFSTISKQDSRYSTDMWRGGAWLNLNYFIIKGLLNYGYTDLANEIKDKTLDGIYKWYKETGVIYEFYDSANKVIPYMCDRKGKQGDNPDFRNHLHSISDFNWSACFTILFIQDELY